MTPIVMGVLRHLLTTLGGGLVANGTLSDNELQAAIGAIVTLIGVGLSVWAKRAAPSAAPGQ